eukprot:m.112116 g.112116  ORF g.112116 m.112116 type:complete len:299 (+) comp14366_c5_seq1:728-1624(+)
MDPLRGPHADFPGKRLAFQPDPAQHPHAAFPSPSMAHPAAAYPYDSSMRYAIPGPHVQFVPMPVAAGTPPPPPLHHVTKATSTAPVPLSSAPTFAYPPMPPGTYMPAMFTDMSSFYPPPPPRMAGSAVAGGEYPPYPPGYPTHHPVGMMLPPPPFNPPYMQPGAATGPVAVTTVPAPPAAAAAGVDVVEVVDFRAFLLLLLRVPRRLDCSHAPWFVDLQSCVSDGVSEGARAWHPEYWTTRQEKQRDCGELTCYRCRHLQRRRQRHARQSFLPGGSGVAVDDGAGVGHAQEQIQPPGL